MRRPEAALHRMVATYFRATLPPEVFWTTFPAGGGGKVRGAVLRGLGLADGVPDLLLCHDGRAYWIELKAEKGRVSEAQGRCHTRLMDAGCPVVIARSLDDVQRALANWRIPTRDAAVRRRVMLARALGRRGMLRGLAGGLAAIGVVKPNIDPGNG